MAGLPSGTVSFLFTDIEGSTSLWEAAPDSMNAALLDHDRIVRDAAAVHDGVVFAAGGDGFAIAFHRAADALSAAMVAQRMLRRHDWGGSIPLRVRMAVHSGEAVERQGNYFGPPVNRTARLLDVAAGGQIVCSDVAAALYGTAGEVEFVDLGPRTFRGVLGSVRVWGVVAGGIEPPTAFARKPETGNLPSSPTYFVGRTDEVKQLQDLVAECRILTLVGTGGVGKTRLAIETARELADEFADGTWMVELGPLSDPDSIVHALATVLGVRPGPLESPEDSVTNWLSERRLLLILDNCEHVLSKAAEVIDRMVGRCPGIVVLATSREPLGLPGEYVWRVRSLDPFSEAPELFEECLQRLDAGSGIETADRATVVSICERLDGIPLAIELAAGRAAALGLHELLRRLDDRFRILRGTGRGRAARHETLQATVGWSYQLLSSEERQLFETCSVFAGSFDLEAAEGISDAMAPAYEVDVADVLPGLVAKSMVTVEREAHLTRYRILETLRQYGQDRLVDHGRLAMARDCHLAWYVGRARHLDELAVGPSEMDAFTGFDRDWDNFRAAVDWAAASDQFGAFAALVAATGSFAIHRYRRDHADWVRLLIHRCGDDLVEVRGMDALWAYFLGEPERALTVAEDVLDRSGDDRTAPATFWAWFARHFAAFSVGRLAEAADAADACRAAAGSRVDRLVSAIVCRTQIAMAESDSVLLRAVIEELRPLVETLANDSARAYYTGLQGMLAYLEGDVAGALASLERAVEHARAIGSITLTNGWQSGLAMVLSAAVHDETAQAAYASLIRQCLDDDDWATQWQALEGLAVHFANNELGAALPEGRRRCPKTGPEQDKRDVPTPALAFRRPA